MLTEQPAIVVHNWPIYLISALVIVISANALAFIIASLVNSYEQAIVLGGGINILLAAISGFMVPMNIMPEIMTTIASWSPLYWSAETIRAIFMGNYSELVFSYLINLLLFSAISLVIARYLFVMKIRKLLWN
jgi:ABC-2 type transport system permease protein